MNRDDWSAALAAYLDGFALGDSDAYTGKPCEWTRHPVAVSGEYAFDATRGYLDGFAQETARKQGGRL